MKKKSSKATSKSLQAVTMASRLTDYLAAKEKVKVGAPSSWESVLGQHKRRHALALAEVEKVASLLGQDVGVALGEQFEELSTANSDFRQGMKMVFTRILRAASKTLDQVVIFNEAVPGFTLLMFKKTSPPETWVDESQPTPLSEEEKAAGIVMSQFVERTQQRVMTVETDDVYFVFFPASDMKKNLKEMGFYWTD